MEDDEVNRDDKLDGWYYKKDGQTFGPVSPLELKELLASGRLQPRQAVWRQGAQAYVFVHAATAVKEADLAHPAMASRARSCPD